jgi:hypothetical protein
VSIPAIGEESSGRTGDVETHGGLEQNEPQDAEKAQRPGKGSEKDHRGVSPFAWGRLLGRKRPSRNPLNLVTPPRHQLGVSSME